MTTVLLLNNYSMRAALDLHARGEYPAQHLYGYPPDGLPREGVQWMLAARSIYDIRWLTYRGMKRLRDVVVRLMGDPVQQVHALLSDADILFSADQWSAGSLLILRRLRLIRRPIVVLVHHPPKSRLKAAQLAAADRLVFLSEHTRDLTDTKNCGAVLSWGPETQSAIYDRVGRADHRDWDFVCAGKTNRDYGPIRALAAADGLSGVIYDGSSRTEFRRGVDNRTQGRSSYLQILEDVARARTVVIPLHRRHTMAGLTEVADALAVGTPCVVTSSPAFPYDLEGLQAGSVATENSVEALRAALATLNEGSTSPRLSVMLAQYNMGTYRSELTEVFREVSALRPLSGERA